jgi:hypothetical protein
MIGLSGGMMVGGGCEWRWGWRVRGVQPKEKPACTTPHFPPRHKILADWLTEEPWRCGAAHSTQSRGISTPPPPRFLNAPETCLHDRRQLGWGVGGWGWGWGVCGGGLMDD